MKKTIIFMVMLVLLTVFIACENDIINESQQLSEAESIVNSENSIIEYSENTEIMDDSFTNESSNDILFEDNSTNENSDIESRVIDLITCSPYGEAIEDDELTAELIPVAEKILVAESIMNGDNPYINSDEIIKNVNTDYNYYAVLPELASTEDELCDYFKKIFTDKYCDSIKLEENLFEIAFYGDDAPLFKTIDEKLCMLSGYYGVPPRYDATSLKILNKESNRVEALIEGISGLVFGDYYYQFVTLVYSDEYGWRLDESEVKDYNADEQYFYHLFIGNAEKISTILSGSDIVISDDMYSTTERNGKVYNQIEYFMTIEEMKNFFNLIFSEELAKKYTDEYIEDVYIERNGRLYRQTNAKKAVLYEYLPEFFMRNGKTASNDISVYIEKEIKWRNPLTNDIIIKEMKVEYFFVDYDDSGLYNTRKLTSLKIESELLLITYTD